MKARLRQKETAQRKQTQRTEFILDVTKGFEKEKA
jgi:hypothetical protein